MHKTISFLLFFLILIVSGLEVNKVYQAPLASKSPIERYPYACIPPLIGCYNTAGVLSCIDPSSDTNNCGVCGNICLNGCSSSQCVCGSGFRSCAGATPGSTVCTPIDDSSCSSCGVACTTGCIVSGNSGICPTTAYTYLECVTQSSGGTSTVNSIPIPPKVVSVPSTSTTDPTITPAQCASYCQYLSPIGIPGVQGSYGPANFFTLVIDTTDDALNNLVYHTLCSCFHSGATTPSFDLGSDGTVVCNLINNIEYGETVSGFGNWAVYTLP
jgi:hypothetical protein